ncbi:acyl carrier protein [bacterium]|jgi:acyl carrier protein|nr:acyl carrier protein [bacterium]
MKDVEQRTYKILNNLLKPLDSNIVVNSVLLLDDIPGMDSLFFLEIVSALEKEFKFYFDLEEIINIKKVEDFILIIKNT